MLLSMTGYGRAVQTYADRTITVEIRSLNSKFTDLRFKIPQNYKEKEPEMRKIISGTAQRGKVDVTIDVKSLEGDGEYALNIALFKKYHQELRGLSDELGIASSDMLQAILRLPNVVAADEQSIEDAEWQVLQNVLHEALSHFTSFRTQEGIAMEKDCQQRVKNIATDITKLDPFEAERVVKLRERIQKKMEEYVGKENIDANRFEQEILYYLEKIDITEEKVRLAQHCKYFQEVLATEESLKGRKLSFISQEMGREINTLGSKANSSEIQRIVVRMKDELEKIKEQVANSV
ncbi:MAG: YicC/YloC family endoribonuclease, partial [Bacteroidota bacterium]